MQLELVLESVIQSLSDSGVEGPALLFLAGSGDRSIVHALVSPQTRSTQPLPPEKSHFPPARSHPASPTAGMLQKCMPAIRQRRSRPQRQLMFEVPIPSAATTQAPASNITRSSASNAATAPHPHAWGTNNAADPNNSATAPTIHGEGALPAFSRCRARNQERRNNQQHHHHHAAPINCAASKPETDPACTASARSRCSKQKHDCRHRHPHAPQPRSPRATRHACLNQCNRC